MDSKKKNLTVCILFGLLLAVAFLACLFLPKEATSDSERRKLAAMPAFTLDTVLSGRFMSGFETYTQDHFPFRDQFRTLKALSATGLFHRQDNNGIYVSDGFAAAVEYPLNESSLDRAAGRFQYLYDKYLNGSNRVFLSVIPDKNCFLARESGHLSMDYAQLESLMAQKVGFADYISILRPVGAGRLLQDRHPLAAGADHRCGGAAGPSHGGHLDSKLRRVRVGAGLLRRLLRTIGPPLGPRVHPLSHQRCHPGLHGV